MIELTIKATIVIFSVALLFGLIWLVNLVIQATGRSKEEPLTEERWDL